MRGEEGVEGGEGGEVGVMGESEGEEEGECAVLCSCRGADMMADPAAS